MKILLLLLLLLLIIIPNVFAQGYWDAYQDTTTYSLSRGTKDLEGVMYSDTIRATEDGLVDTLFALMIQSGDAVGAKLAWYKWSDTSLIDSSAEISVNTGDKSWVGFPMENLDINSLEDTLYLLVIRANNTLGSLNLYKTLIVSGKAWQDLSPISYSSQWPATITTLVALNNTDGYTFVHYRAPLTDGDDGRHQKNREGAIIH